MAALNYTPIQLYYSSTPTQVPLAANMVEAELALNISDGKLYFKNNAGVVTLLASSASTSGNVEGPASSINNAVPVFDGTTGKLIKDSGKLLPSGGIVGTSDIQTLSNKTISADDNTLSGIAPSSFVLSNASGNIDGAVAQKAIPAGVVVGTTDTQTLTNKTISADDNTLSGIAPSSFVLSNASGNIDGVVAQKAIPAGVVVGTTDTQTLTNKTISADDNTLSGIAASSFVLSNASGNIDGAAAQKAIPAGVVVGTTDTQTLTNKTISADDNTLSGIAASSFVLSNASGNIDGAAAQKAIPAGVVVGTTDTQTLTNKTINGSDNTISNVSLTTSVTGTLPIGNGGTGSTTSAGARTGLGASTLGSNLFTITNPSAITFPRFNADNTVSALNAADFRTAIGAGTGGGSVTSVGLSMPTQFTVTNSPVTGSGTLTAAWNNQTANQVFAAPNGTAGAPTFRALVSADIPTLNQDTTGTADKVKVNALVSDATSYIMMVNNAGSGTGQTPSTYSTLYFDTTTDTIQGANISGNSANVTGTVAVANGGTGQTTYTNGQLLIGNTTGNTLTKATLTQGTGITITNGAGSITIANAGVTAYPGAGIAVSTGSAWGTSLTAPTGSLVGTTATQTLTNKTISVDDNTVSGIAANSFVLSDGTGNINGAAAQKAIPAGTVVGTSDTQTLTNKTVEAGTFTNGYTEETVSANLGSTYTIDLTNGSLQILTLTISCTYTFPTPVAGKSFMLVQKQDATGGWSVTWPASVKWPSGIAPTLTSTANKADKFIFTAIDGTSWIGSVAGQNYTV